jgi:N-acyl-L-homoserine lactone synthetase
MAGVLEVGDAVARDLLSAIAPLRIDEARDERERSAGYRLRYAAVVERGLASADAFPGGEERDEYDDRAVQIVGWDGERAIATCRLVRPVAGARLPVEAVLGRDLPGSESMVDFGRGVVDPSWRRGDHRVFMGLVARAWLSMRARGISTLVAVAPAHLLELYRQIGFTVQVLGEPRVVWNEERYPILVDGRETARSLARHWGGAATARLGADVDGGR